MAGETDPLGQRKNALDAFLEAKLAEGFRIGTHTETHAIIVAGGHGPSLLRATGSPTLLVLDPKHLAPAKDPDAFVRERVSMHGLTCWGSESVRSAGAPGISWSA